MPGFKYEETEVLLFSTTKIDSMIESAWDPQVTVLGHYIK